MISAAVGDLEPRVSDASSSGEPARLGHLDPGKVRAQSVPAASSACRENGHITAAAPHVENVLPSWIRALASNRAVSRPSNSARAVPDAPFGTFLLKIAMVAGPCQSGEFCAPPPVRSAQQQTNPDPALYGCFR